MRPHSFLALLALLPAALQGQGTGTNPPPATRYPPPGSYERLFYYTDREPSYESLVAHIDQIDVLGPQVYVLDSLGVIYGTLDPRVLALAKQHKVKVMPLFTNERFNQPALRRFLADTAARARSVASLVALCRENGYWGIQFDVENLNMQDGPRFTAWYRDAADALHRAGYKISIATVHRTEDFAGPTPYHRFLYDSWRGGYDLKAIGAASDFISVMSYDQHTGRTPPGPVAGLPWARAVADYYLRYVPAEKLSLGIPLYGKHWSARAIEGDARVGTNADYVNWSWGSALAARNGATMQWDSTQAVPFTYYEVGGTFEWLFLENARSFAAKLALMREKKLRGFSAWSIGTEDEAIWGELRK
jgi:spore germination protein YaaH